MALSSLFVEIGGSIAGLRTAMGEAVAEVKRVEKATGETATGLERSSKIGAAAAVALGAGFVLASGKAVQMAADFESSQNRLVATAGESKENLKMVGDGLLDLAGKVGYSAQDLSNAMYTVESGGFHGADGLKVMTAAAQGAKAENADLGTVTNALTTIMQDYKGKGLDDPTLAMSKLVAITGTGKMTFQDLAGSLSSVLPLASKLDIGIDQVGAAVATMTQHGESADLATQHLNHTIDKLSSGTPAMTRSMQQFGISAQDVKLNLGDDKRGLAGTVQLLSKAITDKMGPSGQIAIDILQKSGQAAHNAQQMISTMPPKLAEASKAFQDGSMSMKDYRKVIMDMGGSAVAEGSQFMSLVKSSMGFSDAIKSGQPDVMNFAGALKSMVGDQTTADTLMQLMGTSAGEYADNLKTVQSATKAADGTTKGFDDTQQTLNFKMDSLKANVGSLAIKWGNVLIPILSTVVGWLDSVGGWMERNAGVAYVLAGVIGVVLAGAMAAFVVKSMKGIADLTTGLTKGVASMAQWVARTVFGYGAAGAAAEGEAATEAAAGGSRARTLVSGIADGAKWLAAKTTQYASAAAGATVNAARESAAWVASNSKMVLDQTVSGAKWVATKIATYIAASAAAVTQAAIASAAWIAENAVAIAATGGIILIIGLLVAAVVWLINHWDDVKRVAGEVWDWVEKRFQDAADWISARVQDILSFLGWLGSLPGKAIEWFKGLFDNAVKWLQNAVDWVKSLPGKLLSALGNVGSLLLDTGKNIVIGLWNGLASMGGWLFNQVWGWIKSVIPGPIKSVLGISSPSKLMHYFGTMTAQGMGDGMIANASAVTDASKHLANQAASALGQHSIQASLTAGFAMTGAAVSGLSPLGGGPGIASAAGVAGAGGQTIVVQVQGSIVDSRGLFDAVQKESLRNNIRNPINGLATLNRV